ncbi:hypothetical protein [uncultured Methylobacterium sp.]|uniref:hypothetical protein n=1 Tax=uncultured Methylobacterium sp. TaxID=157278 RepID=UPI00259AE5C8|nr:hypothetical protein [uncultured Methylobacterium sp.]
MFGSDVMEVALGLILLFLFVSLLCTALREMIETVMKSRAGDLEKGIAELLFENAGTKAFSKEGSDLAIFYQHSMISSLYEGDYKPKPENVGLIAQARRCSRLPAYIPSRNFANALIDLVRADKPADEALTIGGLRASVCKLEDGRLRTVLLTAIDDAQDDIGRVRLNLEGWYNATMDRVSGWYKRRTQAILAVLGLLVAVMFNIDAVQVAQKLNTDKSYRQAVVAQAGLLLQTPAPSSPKAQGPGQEGATGQQSGTEPAPRARLEQLQKDLDQAGFLIGWPAPQLAGCNGGGCAGSVVRMILGWLVTALAVTLGAPFWFDLLNKFMVVRSTVKPAEKSAPEASKDSQPA